ncbi:MAG TPA: GGDEF domain-containing protein [Rubrivivax sp.]|nr:GGDEF domain-containing protein [Rubrivivax sp.]
MHIPTLALAVVLVSAILALVVGLVAEKGQRDGMVLWSAGLWAHALAHAVFGQRGQIGEGLSVVLTTTLLSTSLALVGESLCQFHARRPHRLLLWAPVVASFLGAVVLWHTPPARILAGSAIYAVQVVLLLEMLVRARASTAGRGQYLVIVSWLLVLPLLALRAFAAWQQPEAVADVNGASVMMGMTFTIVLSGALLGTLGFVLMTKERADRHSRQMAMFDELTGLASRRSVLEALAQQAALARRSGQALTVLMLDIDHFKQVNDQYGHLAGDLALRHVAAILRARFRRQDLLGRFGGEEFLAILPATAAAEGGMVLAETVRAALAAAPAAGIGGSGLSLTVSIGVAELARHAAADTEAVVRAADLAMYRAKVGGRNRVELARAPDYLGSPDQRMRMPGTAPGHGSTR